MPTDAVPQRVFEWLLRLHALTAGSSAGAEAAGRVEIVAPMIAERFPVVAFNQRSLEHVAAACRFWPAYGELVTSMREWWRENRHLEQVALPAPTAQPEPARELPSEADLQAVADLVARCRAEIAEGGRSRAAMEPPPPKPVPLRDVTAKGAELEAIRQRRGLKVPA